MKGPFSIWAFFGLTLWIDVGTHLFIRKKEEKIDPYLPVRDISVIIPIHKEPVDYVKITIDSLYKETYPLKNIIICGDIDSDDKKLVMKNFNKKDYPNLFYCESPHKSKARKINYVVKEFEDSLGEFIYVRDCRVKGSPDCIEKMMAYFNSEKVAAVTSYGRVSIPRNFLSRSYFYGKAWINEIGRFRKNAQEKRKAVFVICGASAVYRKSVLRKIPIPYKTKTEDTHYTWVLQENDYSIRVADDAVVSAPEVDGKGLSGIKNQIKQSYRWSSGTIQCLYKEGGMITKNKRLSYSTIFPGLLESIGYTIPLILLPILFLILPWYALGFFIGDTVFSLLGTLIILPKKFLKTVYHYPQIMFFKYLNAIIFAVALTAVTSQALRNKTDEWGNEWTPPETS